MLGASAAETFREWRPSILQAEHVVCVWVQRVAADTAPFLHHTVPNGSVELVCALGSTPRLVGPGTGPGTTRRIPGSIIVGIRFRPEAATAVLGQPVSNLVDATVDADDITGPASLKLGDALSQAHSDRDLLRLLHTYLADRLPRCRPLDPLAKEAVRRLSSGDAASVSDLAAALYVSERQLRRRVEAASGLPPKTLHRQLRFQRFLALAGERDGPAGQLADLAAQVGYADHAHLTRESVRLEGRPPRAVLLEAEHRCRGAHDHAASYQPLL